LTTLRAGGEPDRWGAGGTGGRLLRGARRLGVPEFEARRYEGRVKDGGVLLFVHGDTSEEIARAKDVLKTPQAEGVSSSSGPNSLQGQRIGAVPPPPRMAREDAAIMPA
jgi:hypothetical protein